VPPPKAYLDTCIVSGLAKGDLDAPEASALLRILQARTAGRVELWTSDVVNAEITRIPAHHRTPHAAIYELLTDVPTAPTHLTASRLLDGSLLQSAWREDSLFTQLRNLLPDPADAEHIFQAAKNNVAYLLTVDHETFLKHATAAKRICGVQLMTPVAFENLVLTGAQCDG